VHFVQIEGGKRNMKRPKIRRESANVNKIFDKFILWLIDFDMHNSYHAAIYSKNHQKDGLS